MNRRHVLHALAVGTVFGAGCLDTAEESPSASNSVQTTTTTMETTNMATATDGGQSLSIDSVETFAYSVRLNDLGTSPAGQVTTLSELSARERDVVEAALDGEYETDEPTEWLTKFLSGAPRISHDGTYFQLESSLPTYTITAEAVAEADVDGTVASYETYEEAVTHDGRVMSGLLRIARRDGMRLGYLWPSLREFLDTYDAAHYHGQVLGFSVREDDPGAPYTITAESLSLDELARGSVWDATEEPADVREVVRAAGEESSVYGLHDLPSGFIANLDDHDYVFLDGTFYTAYVESRESPPVSLSATARAPDELRLELENESDGELAVNSGAPRPFGVLYCHPRGNSKPRHLLWTDAYEKNDHVSTEGRQVTMVNSIGLTTTVAAGEAVGETFEIPPDLAGGQYVLEGSVGVRTGGDGSTLPYRVVFTVP